MHYHWKEGRVWQLQKKHRTNISSVIHLWAQRAKRGITLSYHKNTSLPLSYQKTGVQNHVLPFCKTILMLIGHFPCALAPAALLTDGKPGPSTEMGCSLTSDRRNGLQVVITALRNMIYRSLPHATHTTSPCLIKPVQEPGVPTK